MESLAVPPFFLRSLFLSTPSRSLIPTLLMVLRPGFALLLRSNKSRSYSSNTRPFLRSRTTTTIGSGSRGGRRLLLTSGAAVTICAAGFGLYHSNETFRHLARASLRCSKAITTGVLVAADYQWTLWTGGDKSKCHKRCAERVLSTLEKLGGIYVKWGQHLSSMVYILPLEWTTTLSRLQDRCEVASSEHDIRSTFRQDFCKNQDIDDVFEEFDFAPIGVASLAQVHKAKLRSSGEWVAVKVQHPFVDEFCRLDIDTVSWIFGTIQKLFPDFGFHWVAEDMRESLPQELDFRYEAANAEKVVQQFAGEKTALVIPKVLWASKRMLCMECKLN